MKTARQTAFEILNKMRRDSSYSNILIDSEFNNSDLNDKDKSFASALVYGVTERQITIDYQLSLYLSQPLKKLKPQVLTILRMGAYQLIYMDKIPTSAALNESVKLAKNNKAAFASGLVNAVLHKIEKNGLRLPDEDSNEYFTVKYSVPHWLYDLWIKSYGKINTEQILKKSFGAAETVIRVNTLRTSSEELIKAFLDEGITVKKHDVLKNALIVEGKGAVHKTKAYSKGLFHIEDAASQLCCLALKAKKGETVFDICAAPGGKSFTLAESMNNEGRIFSFDVYEHRLKLIEDGAKRLGISNISAIKNDGTKYNKHLPKADKVLCDVPCAGLGVIRRKPEIRYKESAQVDKLFNLQYSILCISSMYLKKGGILVYSTCSLNPHENEDVIKKFLSEHSDFESVRVLESIKRYSEDTDCLTLMPHIHNSDGFFISAVRKTEDV